MRLGEALPLTWANVDRDGGTVTLFTSKNGEGRSIPLDPDLTKLIERRWRLRAYSRPDGTAGVSEFVFHRDGFRPWELRVAQAKNPRKLFHDPGGRRSATSFEREFRKPSRWRGRVTRPTRPSAATTS